MNTQLVLLLACLGMIGSLGIDTYLPAFGALAAHFQVSPLLLQQSLTSYLMGMALMMLLYGTLSDCFGRRPVILWSLSIFTLSSFGAASSNSIDALLAWRILQGLAAGAGSVVGRAIIQDRTDGPKALRAMSQVIMAFALAPAVAPTLGGWLLQLGGWRSIFIFLGAFSTVLLIGCWFGLAESLPKQHRQRFSIISLSISYLGVIGNKRFILLAVAGGLSFAVFSLYIGAASAFVMTILQLGSSDFAWLFVPLVVGMISGSWTGANLAKHFSGATLICAGYIILLLSTGAAVLYASLTDIRLPWATLPLGAATFGLALVNPGLALGAMQQFPSSRGLASSLNSFVNTLFFALFAGGIAPLLAHDARLLAWGTLLSVTLSATLWLATHLYPPSLTNNDNS
jgi:DHA1 family bicyclomycin/chloramphenicol resistance-like MFS transporter